MKEVYNNVYNELWISACPCKTNCPDGCNNCPNPVCQNAVLVLSTSNTANKPMVIDWNDEFNMTHNLWRCFKIPFLGYVT